MTPPLQNLASTTCTSILTYNLSPSKQNAKDSPKPSHHDFHHDFHHDILKPPPSSKADSNRISRHNFSRPNWNTSSRPDTSSSNRDNAGLWRAPYMGGPTATSSMVDLAAPRPPGMGNMRYNNSDVNLGTRFGNGSASSLVKASPVTTGSLPGTPNPSLTPNPSMTPNPSVMMSSKVNDVDNPPISKTRDVDNPLNINFGNDPELERPNTPLAAMGPKNSLEQFEFGLRDTDNIPDPENMNHTGYPSPPPSINSTNTAERPSSSRRNQPSALRNVDTATGPKSLPSPAASTSEDVWETPVIRNVQAKRDTLTFHAPRRRSLSMEVGEKEKDKEEGEGAKTTQVVEGFTGNFSGFDFGESVRRASGMRLPEVIGGGSERGVSPTDVRKPFERTESPLSGRKRSPTMGEEKVERERMTGSPVVPAPVQQQQPVRQISPLAERHTQPQPHHQPQQPPPTQALPQPPSHHQLPPPSRPPTTPIPLPPPKSSPRPDRSPNPSSRPGYINRPLDPPPRGFRPRIDSDPRVRRPNVLRVPPPLVDRPAPRSPYGPPPEEGSYMRSEPSPKPPVDGKPHTPRGIEGDFPVIKGLPRGRPPPRVDSRPDSPYGLNPGPRPPPRQRPMYPIPPQPEQDAAAAAAPNHRFTLPDWDAFDRADPHRSAMPAPLSPFRTDPPLSPMRPPRSPPSVSPTSPAWPFHTASHTSSPISPTPPSIPSPSFQSLEKSISSTSETFATTFETPYDNTNLSPKPKPLISPVTDWDRSPGAMRVEGRRAPPRPTPITLPPKGVDAGLMTPVGAAFI